MAQQQLQLARGEQEGIALAKKRALANLKNFLGLPSNQDITPAFQDSRRQVLGSFNPATVTLEQAKTRSYELKVFEIYKQLQHYNIRLAIAKSFPTIIFTTQTPDPLSVKHRLWPLCWLRSRDPGVGWVYPDPQRLPAKSHLEADWG